MPQDVKQAAPGKLDEFRLRDELRALRTQIPDSPALNPIVSLAFDLSRRLESGDIIAASPLAEARAALESLGYKPIEAQKLTDAVTKDGMSTDQIIREALKRAIR